MKKSTKKDRVVEERDKPLPAKKRSLKPWKLEYMYTDAEYLKKHAGEWYFRFRPQKHELNIWYRDDWEKFVSLEQAIRELNKAARSYNFKQKPIKELWKYAGREFRLINVDTEEIIPLTLGDREIYAA